MAATSDWLSAIAISLAVFAFQLYRTWGWALSPDGRYYLAMARGEKVIEPYSRRWLLPWVLGTEQWRWLWARAIAYTLMGPAVYWLTHSLMAVWFALWLPGMTINIRLPVLVDQVAMTLMVVAAGLMVHGYPIAATCMIFVASQVKEPAGPFGMLLAPPLALGAVLGTLLVLFMGRIHAAEKDPKIAWQSKPFAAARMQRDPMMWEVMLLPWGAMLLFVPLVQAWPFLALMSIALGYAQLLIANDSARLYQWASPAVLMAMSPAFSAAPQWLRVAAVVVHPFLCGAYRGV